MKQFTLFTILIILSFFILECGETKDRNDTKGYIINFNDTKGYIINFNDLKKDTINFNMYIDKNIYTGISIPSDIDTLSKYFTFFYKMNQFSFGDYYYKIYYQNSSYKFNEKLNDNTYNPLSSENFYGSWEDVNRGFVKIENGLILDSFRISGNPRNEQKYHTPQPQQVKLSEELLDEKINLILENEEWYSSIKTKATKNKVSVKKQLRDDAIWIIKNSNNGEVANNKWMRNPRVGNYNFILVVTSKDDLSKIPKYIQNINLKKSNSNFENPFYYFLYGDGSKLENTTIFKSNQTVNLSVKFNFEKGIYVNSLEVDKNKYDTTCFSNICGTSKYLFDNAQFEQHFHNINKNYPLNNIPVIEDVTKNYTKDDFNKNKNKYKNNGRIKKLVAISHKPCNTVKYLPKSNSFEIKIPGNEKTFIKENVGIKGRIGFTYGKYIAKIKFPKLISPENVWNGVTNAFWLIYQEEGKWNHRRMCKDKKAKKSSYYSEIDFEIVKASKFWPNTSYPNKVAPIDTPSDNRDIIVSCTNWDLACKDPINYSVGAKKFMYNNNSYELHRWYDSYKAITSKVPVNHDWLFDNYTYFEIDWQPDKIIWRIGKDLDAMETICQMDNKVTCIPNNQMVPVISLEFHAGDWWPTTPFHQDNIPFPKEDIKAEIVEIMIK